MTNQFSSEQDLFESEEDKQSKVQPPHKIKRNSLGPRLPISTSPPRQNPYTMAEGFNVGKGKGTGESGTVIGLPGMRFKEENSLIMIGKDSEGKDKEINLFESVFSGGSVGSVKLEQFLNYVHLVGKLNFADFIEGISYQGFNREFYIRAALAKVSVSVFCRFAILGAVRGSNFSKIVDSCLVMPQDLITLHNNGIIIKKAKKKDDLTILRFTASIPHWVAFWLFTVNYPKKIDTEDCPGWLQFPGAASLPMSKEVRLQHISFCKAFSALLPGGTFNGNIYFTAYSNPIPKKDLPKMIKEGLGIGEAPGGEITQEEVRAQAIMAVAKR